MITNKDLANLIFPDVHETINDLENRYPSRNLKEGAEVTRFAPSPTGYLHTGSLFTALIAKKVSSQSEGIFYLRLEDTDTKREIKGSGELLVKELNEFGIIPDEGYLGNHEIGKYGPYIQSKRKEIYKAVAKHLIETGDAYPCFCTANELDEMRSYQERNKIVPGYYGEYAKCRNLSIEQAYEKIKNGDSFVIRFKSKGNHNNKITVHDEIRGDIDIAQNDLDVIIYKSDELPTYHFAHVCDDHFMHTTVVIRGEEWISSLPIHYEMFNALGFKLPKYAHLPLIMKLDNGNKRKLSKRHDPEAAVSFFLKEGYPTDALIIYLLTIANSNFEEWFFENHYQNADKFVFSFDKMSLDGALFDIDKLQFFSRELLAKRTASMMCDEALTYAKEYDPALFELIIRNKDYFTSIMNIEREKENPRKDYAKYGDIYPLIKFFYHDLYLDMANTLAFNPKFDSQTIIDVLLDIRDNLDGHDEQEWFTNLKAIAERHKFAPNGKLFKQNPDLYIGHVGDVAEMLRISIATVNKSPNLFSCIDVIGIDEIRARINIVVEKLTA